MIFIIILIANANRNLVTFVSQLMYSKTHYPKRYISLWLRILLNFFSTRRPLPFLCNIHFTLNLVVYTINNNKLDKDIDYLLLSLLMKNHLFTQVSYQLQIWHLNYDMFIAKQYENYHCIPTCFHIQALYSF